MRTCGNPVIYSDDFSHITIVHGTNPEFTGVNVTCVCVHCSMNDFHDLWLYDDYVTMAAHLLIHRAYGDAITKESIERMTVDPYCIAILNNIPSIRGGIRL